LSKNHDITLFSLIKDEKEKKYLPELKKYCKKVKVFRRSKSPWTLRNIFLTGFGPYPFLVIRNLSPAEKKGIEKELSKEDYDLIHAETFYTMPHIPETDIPVLMVEQTIEYLVYKHYVGNQAPIPLRPLLAVDVAKLKYWEKSYWKKADKAVAVSEADKGEMRKLVPGLDVGIVPNGVNLDFFRVRKGFKTKEPKMLFIANFKWLQNVEAAQLLINEVYPEVRKKLPGVKVWIVGQHIPEEIKSEASEGVIVDDLDEADEDSIKNAYYDASVFVSPLRGPGGTRLKHFAAMASKLPLITTSVGAEGLGAKDGVHLVVRDNPKDIAKAATELLKDSKKAKKIADNAREMVQKKFSWEKMAEYLDEIYEETSKDAKKY
jgi:glycosyltransferase involved in cell wall biosynthesis